MPEVAANSFGEGKKDIPYRTSSWWSIAGQHWLADDILELDWPDRLVAGSDSSLSSNSLKETQK